MKQLTLLLITLLMAVAGSLSAQETNLRMRFDFSNVSGTSVTDGVSGTTARMVNSATVVDMGQYKVLSLGAGSGYLDMTTAAGTLFASIDDCTVAVCYRVDDDASL